MASGQTCSFRNDYGSHTGFFARVNNSTNSIYSDRYLNIPFIAPGIAELITTKPSKSFFLDGTLNEGCNRHSVLVQIQDNTEYGLQITPNSEGRAPVTTLKNDRSSNYFWTNLTDAFYVDNEVNPLSLWIPNAGSYYACTSGEGNVSVYFQLNTTGAPSGCQDILLDIDLWRNT